MEILEAILLGLVQGFTEFLPVSSSGHLEIGKYLFGINSDSSLAFSVAVHGATVLSTIIIFFSEIRKLIKGTLKFQLNEETDYVLKIFVSMIPVLIVGLFFKDKVEACFNGNIRFVGAMLILTSAMLAISTFVRKRDRKINYIDAFIIGLAQAFAVIPGISRSGATISAGLILGNSPKNLAKFSFLMVLIPIIGANFIELINGEFLNNQSVGVPAILAGFISAFVSGYLACKWMIRIVQKGKLHWFALYCLILGLVILIAV